MRSHSRRTIAGGTLSWQPQPPDSINSMLADRLALQPMEIDDRRARLRAQRGSPGGQRRKDSTPAQLGFW
jgi:hypothetical protein